MSEGGKLPLGALRAAAASLAAALPPGALAALAPGAPPACAVDPDAWGFAHTPPLSELLAIEASRQEPQNQQQRPDARSGGGAATSQAVCAPAPGTSAAGGVAGPCRELPPALAPLPGGYLDALTASRTFTAPHSLDAMARALGVADVTSGMAGSAAAAAGLLPPGWVASSAGEEPGGSQQQQEQQLQSKQPAEDGVRRLERQQGRPGGEPARQQQQELGPPGAAMTAERAIEELRRRIDGAWSQEAVKRGVAYAKAGARRRREDSRIPGFQGSPRSAAVAGGCLPAVHTQAGGAVDVGSFFKVMHLDLHTSVSTLPCPPMFPLKRLTPPASPQGTWERLRAATPRLYSWTLPTRTRSSRAAPRPPTRAASPRPSRTLRRPSGCAPRMPMRARTWRQPRRTSCGRRPAAAAAAAAVEKRRRRLMVAAQPRRTRARRRGRRRAGGMGTRGR
jgi:hypothetical protein